MSVGVKDNAAQIDLDEEGTFQTMPKKSWEKIKDDVVSLCDFYSPFICGGGGHLATFILRNFLLLHRECCDVGN